MKAPDKIYVAISKFMCPGLASSSKLKDNMTEYIRKDALLDYLQKELERLWELIPDASNEAPTQMEMRYLGEYMATERLIDEIKLL